MLTRSIDLDDPFDLSFEEKLFYNAKRLCVGFAVVAVSCPEIGAGLESKGEILVVISNHLRKFCAVCGRRRSRPVPRFPSRDSPRDSV